MNLLLIMACWASTARATPPESQRTLMSGRFVVTAPHEQIQADVDAAVERAASQFSWAFRGLARRKLAEGANWCPEVSFRLDEETWTVQCLGQVEMTRRLDNSEGPVTLPDGRVFDTEIRLAEPNTLAVDYTADKGTRHVDYRYGEAGALELSVSIGSAYLTTPMTWTIAYQKVE